MPKLILPDNLGTLGPPNDLVHLLIIVLLFIWINNGHSQPTLIRVLSLVGFSVLEIKSSLLETTSIVCNLLEAALLSNSLGMGFSFVPKLNCLLREVVNDVVDGGKLDGLSEQDRRLGCSKSLIS